MLFQNHKKSISFKGIVYILLLTFGVQSIIGPEYAQAQSLPVPQPAHVLKLPPVGEMMTQSAPMTPMFMRGVIVHPENPLELDFIIDHGDTNFNNDQGFQAEAKKLIKYFLASLTIPENELWVNLSPDEPDRIIADSFGDTLMGRDVLAQDYVLKQMTASLMYPDDTTDSIGAKLWERINERIHAQYGDQNMPVNAFNKVWIVPDKATIYEDGTSAYVVECTLKAMLEEDYVVSDKNTNHARLSDEPAASNISDIVRAVIIPEIEHEINHGEAFASLRQIVHSLVLAGWYKKKLKTSLLSQLYVDRGKTEGVDTEDKQISRKIYDHYLEGFKQGVFDLIREEYNPQKQEIVARKYFSGGLDLQALANPAFGDTNVRIETDFDNLNWGQKFSFAQSDENVSRVNTRLVEVTKDNGGKKGTASLDINTQVRMSWQSNDAPENKTAEEKFQEIKKADLDVEPIQEVIEVTAPEEKNEVDNAVVDRPRKVKRFALTPAYLVGSVLVALASAWGALSFIAYPHKAITNPPQYEEVDIYAELLEKRQKSITLYNNLTYDDFTEEQTEYFQSAMDAFHPMIARDESVSDLTDPVVKNVISNLAFRQEYARGVDPKALQKTVELLRRPSNDLRKAVKDEMWVFSDKLLKNKPDNGLSDEERLENFKRLTRQRIAAEEQNIKNQSRTAALRDGFVYKAISSMYWFENSYGRWMSNNTDVFFFKIIKTLKEDIRAGTVSVVIGALIVLFLGAFYVRSRPVVEEKSWLYRFVYGASIRLTLANATLMTAFIVLGTPSLGEFLVPQDSRDLSFEEKTGRYKARLPHELVENLIIEGAADNLSMSGYLINLVNVLQKNQTLDKQKEGVEAVGVQLKSIVVPALMPLMEYLAAQNMILDTELNDIFTNLTRWESTAEELQQYEQQTGKSAVDLETDTELRDFLNGLVYEILTDYYGSLTYEERKAVALLALRMRVNSMDIQRFVDVIPQAIEGDVEDKARYFEELAIWQKVKNQFAFHETFYKEKGFTEGHYNGIADGSKTLLVIPANAVQYTAEVFNRFGIERIEYIYPQRATTLAQLQVFKKKNQISSQDTVSGQLLRMMESEKTIFMIVTGGATEIQGIIDQIDFDKKQKGQANTESEAQSKKTDQDITIATIVEVPERSQQLQLVNILRDIDESLHEKPPTKDNAMLSALATLWQWPGRQWKRFRDWRSKVKTNKKFNKINERNEGDRSWDLTLDSIQRITMIGVGIAVAILIAYFSIIGLYRVPLPVAAQDSLSGILRFYRQSDVKRDVLDRRNTFAFYVLEAIKQLGDKTLFTLVLEFTLHESPRVRREAFKTNYVLAEKAPRTDNEDLNDYLWMAKEYYFKNTDVKKEDMHAAYLKAYIRLPVEERKALTRLHMHIQPMGLTPMIEDVTTLLHSLEANSEQRIKEFYADILAIAKSEPEQFKTDGELLAFVSVYPDASGDPVFQSWLKAKAYNEEVFKNTVPTMITVLLLSGVLVWGYRKSFSGAAKRKFIEKIEANYPKKLPKKIIENIVKAKDKKSRWLLSLLKTIKKLQDQKILVNRYFNRKKTKEDNLVANIRSRRDRSARVGVRRTELREPVLSEQRDAEVERILRSIRGLFKKKDQDNDKLIREKFDELIDKRSEELWSVVDRKIDNKTSRVETVYQYFADYFTQTPGKYKNYHESFRQSKSPQISNLNWLVPIYRKYLLPNGTIAFFDFEKMIYTLMAARALVNVGTEEAGRLLLEVFDIESPDSLKKEDFEDVEESDLKKVRHMQEVASKIPFEKMGLANFRLDKGKTRVFLSELAGDDFYYIYENLIIYMFQKLTEDVFIKLPEQGEDKGDYKYNKKELESRANELIGASDAAAITGLLKSAKSGAVAAKLAVATAVAGGSALEAAPRDLEIYQQREEITDVDSLIAQDNIEEYLRTKNDSKTLKELIELDRLFQEAYKANPDAAREKGRQAAIVMVNAMRDRPQSAEYADAWLERYTELFPKNDLDESIVRGLIDLLGGTNETIKRIVSKWLERSRTKNTSRLLIETIEKSNSPFAVAQALRISGLRSESFLFIKGKRAANFEGIERFLLNNRADNDIEVEAAFDALLFMSNDSYWIYDRDRKTLSRYATVATLSDRAHERLRFELNLRGADLDRESFIFSGRDFTIDITRPIAAPGLPSNPWVRVEGEYELELDNLNYGLAVSTARLLARPVRKPARELLARIATLHEKVQYRIEAVTRLAYVRGAVAKQALIDAMWDSDPLVRERAAQAYRLHTENDWRLSQKALVKKHREYNPTLSMRVLRGTTSIIENAIYQLAQARAKGLQDKESLLYLNSFGLALDRMEDQTYYSALFNAGAEHLLASYISTEFIDPRSVGFKLFYDIVFSELGVNKRKLLEARKRIRSLDARSFNQFMASMMAEPPHADMTERQKQRRIVMLLSYTQNNDPVTRDIARGGLKRYGYQPKGITFADIASGELSNVAHHFSQLGAMGDVDALNVLADVFFGSGAKDIEYGKQRETVLTYIRIARYGTAQMQAIQALGQVRRKLNQEPPTRETNSLKDLIDREFKKMGQDAFDKPARDAIYDAFQYNLAPVEFEGTLKDVSVEGRTIDLINWIANKIDVEAIERGVIKASQTKGPEATPQQIRYIRALSQMAKTAKDQRQDIYSYIIDLLERYERLGEQALNNANVDVRRELRKQLAVLNPESLINLYPTPLAGEELLNIERELRISADLWNTIVRDEDRKETIARNFLNADDKEVSFDRMVNDAFKSGVLSDDLVGATHKDFPSFVREEVFGLLGAMEGNPAKEVLSRRTADDTDPRADIPAAILMEKAWLADNTQEERDMLEAVHKGTEHENVEVRTKMFDLILGYAQKIVREIDDLENDSDARISGEAVVNRKAALYQKLRIWNDIFFPNVGQAVEYEEEGNQDIRYKATLGMTHFERGGGVRRRDTIRQDGNVGKEGANVNRDRPHRQRIDRIRDLNELILLHVRSIDDIAQMINHPNYQLRMLGVELIKQRKDYRFDVLPDGVNIIDTNLLNSLDSETNPEIFREKIELLVKRDVDANELLDYLFKRTESPNDLVAVSAFEALIYMLNPEERDRESKSYVEPNDPRILHAFIKPFINQAPKIVKQAAILGPRYMDFSNPPVRIDLFLDNEIKRDLRLLLTRTSGYSEHIEVNGITYVPEVEFAAAFAPYDFSKPGQPIPDFENYQATVDDIFLRLGIEAEGDPRELLKSADPLDRRMGATMLQEQADSDLPNFDYEHGFAALIEAAKAENLSDNKNVWVERDIYQALKSFKVTWKDLYEKLTLEEFREFVSSMLQVMKTNTDDRKTIILDAYSKEQIKIKSRPYYEPWVASWWLDLTDDFKRREALLEKDGIDIINQVFGDVESLLNIVDTNSQDPNITFQQSTEEQTIYIPLNAQLAALRREARLEQMAAQAAEEYGQEAADEAAMQKQEDDLGGINLNPDLFEWQIKRDGKGVPLPLPQQPADIYLDLKGFIPVIQNITPVNLPQLLGLNTQDFKQTPIRTTKDEVYDEEAIYELLGYRSEEYEANHKINLATRESEISDGYAGLTDF